MKKTTLAALLLGALLVPKHATARGTAWLAVRSNHPDATIWMDGKKLGRASQLTQKAIPAGRHVFRCKKRGFVTHQRSMLARADEVVQLTCVLRSARRVERIGGAVIGGKQGTGILSIITIPPGIPYRFNGKTYRGPQKFRVSAMEYTISAIYRGIPLSKRFEVYPGQRKLVRLDFKRLLRRRRAKLARINLKSDPPGAAVYVDGKRVGATPLLAVARAGRRRIRLVKRGYFTRELTWRLRGHLRVNRKRVKLRSSRAELFISTEPPKVAVALDGSRLPTTTPLRMHVECGTRVLTIAEPGYERYRAELKLPCGKLVTQRIRLVASGAVLRLATRPPGATVRIAGRVVGTTPLARRVDAGTYALRIALAGHAPVTRRVTIVKGGPAVDLGTIALERAHGWLTVRGTPGATVTVDGAELAGRTPIVRAKLTTGKHRVRVAKSGHSSVERAVAVEDGRVVELDETLASIPGTLAWKAVRFKHFTVVDRRTGKVLLPVPEGCAKGTCEAELPPGRYLARLYQPYKKPIRKAFTIRADRTTSVALAFEPSAAGDKRARARSLKSWGWLAVPTGALGTVGFAMGWFVSCSPKSDEDDPSVDEPPAETEARCQATRPWMIGGTILSASVLTTGIVLLVLGRTPAAEPMPEGWRLGEKVRLALRPFADGGGALSLSW